MILFPLLVANLPVRTPCNIIIIERNTPSVLIVVVFQGVCCQIFHIYNSRLLSDPFWKIYCWDIRWITTRKKYIGFSINFIWPFFSTLVTSCNWLVRWISTTVIFFTTLADFEIIFIYSIDYWLFNLPSGKIQRQMLILRLLFGISGLPPPWCNNIMLFTHSLLNKGPIGNEILRSHRIIVKNMKFINKLFNLIISMSWSEMEYRIKSILKYVSDITEVLRLEGSGTLNAISVYQYCST